MLVQIVYHRITPEQAKRHINGYTYELDTEDIDDPQVGDVVLVPPTPSNPEPQIATIISLISTFTGPTKEIIERIILAKDNTPES